MLLLCPEAGNDSGSMSKVKTETLSDSGRYPTSGIPAVTRDCDSLEKASEGDPEWLEGKMTTSSRLDSFDGPSFIFLASS